MKNIKFLIGFTAIWIIGLSSCTKDTSTTNPDNGAVNYDALYVVNHSGNSISVVNLSTEKVQKTINLGTLGSMMSGGMMGNNTSGNNMWPNHISLSPDKTKLVITEPGMDFNSGYDMMMNPSAGSGKIVVLDAITGGLLKEITLAGIPYDAIFSPDGKEIWASLMMPSGKVNVIDAGSYAIQHTITVGSMPAGITFSDDGKKFFVSNGMSGSVMVIDAVTKMITDTIAGSQGIVGAYSGMNGMMYTDNEKNRTISIINTMNDMMSDSIHFGFTPGMVSANTMMNQLWVSDPENSKIHFWTESGIGYTPGGSITVGSGAGAMVFSQTGDTCWVSNRNDNSVSVVDVKGLKELMRIPVGEKPDGLIIRYK